MQYVTTMQISNTHWNKYCCYAFQGKNSTIQYIGTSMSKPPHLGYLTVSITKGLITLTQ